MIIYDRSWADDALCRQVDPELFFPEKGEMPTAAREVCGACPVRRDCLRSALREEKGRGMAHRFGVRGGLTGRERYNLSRPVQQGAPA